MAGMNSVMVAVMSIKVMYTLPIPLCLGVPFLMRSRMVPRIKQGTTVARWAYSRIIRENFNGINHPSIANNMTKSGTKYKYTSLKGEEQGF